MRTRHVYFFGLIILVTLVGITACNRRSDEASPPAPEATRAETPVPPEPRRPQPQPDSEPEREVVDMQVTDAGRRRAAAAAAEPLDPREAAFEAQRFAAQPAYPYDFVIGRLEGQSLMSATEVAAVRAAEEFLDEALAGREVEPREAAPARENAVRLVQSIGQGAGADAVRVGGPELVGDGELSVLFRVLGQSRSLAGEVIMEHAGGEWYSAGIQVQETEREGTGRFDPTSYRPATSLR